MGWRPTAAAIGGLAAALALLHALLAVQWESLTYVRLLGVRLETRRRCGLGGSSLFLPLRMLQGLIMHEVGAASRGRGGAGGASSGATFRWRVGPGQPASAS